MLAIGKRGWCSDQSLSGKVSCTFPSNCGVIESWLAARCGLAWLTKVVTFTSVALFA